MQDSPKRIQPKLCSRKCTRCVDARCVGVHSRNVGAPGGCVEALDVSPMPPMIDTDGVLANA
ncbi:hypothetical protein [Nitratifractor sp.]